MAECTFQHDRCSVTWKSNLFQLLDFLLFSHYARTFDNMCSLPHFLIHRCFMYLLLGVTYICLITLIGSSNHFISIALVISDLL